MVIRNIDIMCIQETKLSNSTVEKRKGHTSVFSSSSNNREHHGVGICYNNKMSKYINNDKQIDSHITTVEISMHGNPMVIASIYIPQNQTPDIPRQHAWELLDETISQTPIAKKIILFVISTLQYTPEKKRNKTTLVNTCSEKECHSSHSRKHTNQPGKQTTEKC